MKFINYSIKNTVVVRFLVILLVLGGIFSYLKLGKLEDPEFKIKEAIVVTMYPGQDAHTVELQVTNKIEEALQKIPNIDYLQSVSKPNYSQVKIKLKESVPSRELDQYWDNVRKKITDAQINMPLGTIPSIVFDDYGAVYGIFLAVTSDGYSYSELSKYSDYILKEFNSINGIAQTAMFGKQTDAVEVIIDREKINSLGISTKLIASSFIAENLISGGGTADYGNLRVNINLNNEIKNMEDLKNVVIFSKKLPDGTNEIIRLGDIAELREGYKEPVSQKMYFDGKMAMGISLSPEGGANVVEVGKIIDKKIIELKEKLPVGINIEKIYYQPELVTSAINNFVINLILSVITVVGVLLVTMGMRSGLIIGSALVYSILGTLILMLPMKIDLQRVSLGSFIIAMGMLVDNSIVVVDNVLVNRNNGMENEKALYEAAQKPALPLLGATTIAALAFLPAYLMPTYVGEYVGSSFWVIGISLMLSWVLCLTQTPVYCKLYLTSEPVKEASEREKKFYDKCRKILYNLMKKRKIVLTAVLGAFLFSMILFLSIPKIFFPDSDKKGFTINMWAAEGSRIEVIDEAAKKLEKYLREDERVVNITTTIGSSPARYYVCTTPEMLNPAFGELILNVKKVKDVEKIGEKAFQYANKNLPGITVSIKKYPNGIPVSCPIEVAFSGPDPQVLRKLSDKAADIMKKYPEVLNLRTDWRNKIFAWEGNYSEADVKRAGLTSVDLATSIMRTTEGMSIGSIKKDDKLVSVILKEHRDEDKNDISDLEQAPIWGVTLESQPLSTLIKNGNIKFEEGQVWRRNRVRTMTVQGDIPVGASASDVRDKFKDEIESIELPKGYTMEWHGEYSEQKKNVISLIEAVPVPVIFMFLICVFLFASVKIPALIFSMLPLCMIGIVPGLFITGKSFGFMSTVGVISLSGMMIKNMIVLVDEIKYEINILRKDKFTALIDSAVSRIRAVSLAAVTTIFGMLPLMRDPLYGDMAATIVFGLFVSTILTLFIFPVVYSVVFHIEESSENI